MTRYALSVLAIALIYVLAHCAVLLCVNAPISSEYWVRELLIVKRAQAARIERPKLLLLGGSSTFFGIDSDQLEQGLARPVYNFGLHFSMRLEWILDEGRKAAKPGDDILLVLEPHFYDCEEMGWSNWQLRAATTWGRGYLDALSPAERIRVSLVAGNATMPLEVLRAKSGSPAALMPRRLAAMEPEREVLERYAEAPSPDAFAYSADNMTPRGDMRNTADAIYDGPAADPATPAAICPEVGVMLRDFAAEMKGRDVDVILDYPPFLIDGQPTPWRADDAAFARDVHAYGFTMLSPRSELFFPRDHFYETVLHLNAKGRAARTRNLIARLQTGGVDAR